MLGVGANGYALLPEKAILAAEVPYEQVSAMPLETQAAHQLMVNWFRVHLVHLAKQAPDFSFSFLSCNSPLALDANSRYPLVRKEIRAVSVEVKSNRQVFIPDAVFAITSDPREARCSSFSRWTWPQKPPSARRVIQGTSDTR